MTETTKPAREGDYGLLRDAAADLVQGCLAQPPIALRQDRLKLGLCFGLATVLEHWRPRARPMLVMGP